MKPLSNNEIETCMSNFRELIENYVEIETLFAELDNILFAYARHLINDPGFCGKNNCDEDGTLYHVNQLKKVFTKEL